ncbi:MAG: DUF2240 family protein [Candidatus Pacearchaeota archaeon]
MNENYEKILNRIAKISGLDIKEIEKMVEDKRAKLSGLISKEGAALIVASEIGISFENEILKINELIPGMRRVNVIGKIITPFQIKSFTTRKGEDSKVANFWVADDSSNIRVVLWDTNHIKLLEDQIIKEGDTVEIRLASMRDGELHLGNFSEIKLSKVSIESVNNKRYFKEKEIINVSKGEAVSIRAFIVQIFEPRFFEICPECGRKIENNSTGSFCKVHDKVVPEKRAILTLFIDDGTDSMRAILFHESIPSLGISNVENLEDFLKEREKFLGKEMIFSGIVRLNTLFNNLELVVENIEEVDIDKVLERLENSL